MRAKWSAVVIDACIAVNLLVLFVAVSVTGLEVMLSKVIATGTVFFWNFLTRNYFIFRQPA
jgi:putative flippase GtrA